MTLYELSKLLHKSPNTIAAAIEQGILPFAVGDKMGGRKTKIIYFPGKLEEYVTGATQEYDLSVKGVAKLLGRTELTVQVFLQRGKFPFGVALKTKPGNTKYTYIIFPAKLEEYLVGRKAA
jgi:hypothetical protein